MYILVQSVDLVHTSDAQFLFMSDIHLEISLHVLIYCNFLHFFCLLKAKAASFILLRKAQLLAFAFEFLLVSLLHNSKVYNSTT